MAEFGCFVGESWWTRYPESRPVTAEGELLPAQDGYAGVNPTVLAVREELLARLAALVRDNELDGVAHFIRWPSRWESPNPRLYATSFDDATLRRFQEDTGTALPSSLREPAERAAWIRAQQPRVGCLARRPDHGFCAAGCRGGAHTGASPLSAGIVQRAVARGEFRGCTAAHHGPGASRARGRCGYLFADGLSPDVRAASLLDRAVSEEAHAVTGKPVWPIIQTMASAIVQDTSADAQRSGCSLHRGTAPGDGRGEGGGTFPPTSSYLFTLEGWWKRTS